MILWSRWHLAFVHNPKAAGSTITALLGQYADRTGPLPESETTAPHGWQTKFHYGPMHLPCLPALLRDPCCKASKPAWIRFGVFRDATNRAMSFWNFMHEKGESPVEWIVRFRRGETMRHNLSGAEIGTDYKTEQIEYLRGCNFIITYSSLRYDLQALLRKARIDREVTLPSVLPRHNPYDQHDRPEPSDEFRELVRQTWPTDYALSEFIG
jgi:hypothetical protein